MLNQWRIDDRDDFQFIMFQHIMSDIPIASRTRGYAGHLSFEFDYKHISWSCNFWTTVVIIRSVILKAGSMDKDIAIHATAA